MRNVVAYCCLCVVVSPFLNAQEKSKLPANTLYACNFRENSRLYTIDPATGDEKEVGKIGEETTDIAFVGNQLYGLSFDSLFEIDPLTGEASAALPHGIEQLNALVAIPNDTTGFYAMAAIAADTTKGAPFVRVDRSSGRASVIGHLGKGLSSAGDLVFVNGKLYATLNSEDTDTTCWVSIDPKSGKATLISDTTIEGIWGLEVRNGKLFGATKLGWVLTIDPSTGGSTMIGTTGLVLGGMAKSP